tara:strand:+ start:256 stop:792 length:537 start_codon:yes stop_codon:yes gene_type:complete
MEAFLRRLEWETNQSFARYKENGEDINAKNTLRYLNCISLPNIENSISRKLDESLAVSEHREIRVQAIKIGVPLRKENIRKFIELAKRNPFEEWHIQVLFNNIDLIKGDEELGEDLVNFFWKTLDTCVSQTNYQHEDEVLSLLSRLFENFKFPFSGAKNLETAVLVLKIFFQYFMKDP